MRSNILPTDWYLMKRFRRFVILVLVLTCATLNSNQRSNAQVKFKIPVVYIDSIFTGNINDPTDTTGLVFSGTFVDTLWFGYHSLATLCRDTLNGFSTHWTLADTGSMSEELLPPISPGGQDIRFISYNASHGCFTDGSRADIRQYIGSGQRDSLRFKTTANPDPTLFHREVLRWPSGLSQYFDSCRIRNVGGAAINVEMTQGTSATSLRFNASQTPSHNFRIVPSGPKVPPPTTPTVILNSPADASSGQPPSLSLVWTAASGALSYTVQVSKGDPTFGAANKVVDESVGSGTTSRALSGLTASTTYYWRVAVFTVGGVSYFQDPPYSFATGATDVIDKGNHEPKSFRLEQNYPDPFNPLTTIRYSVPASGHVRLAVYTMLGAEVALLVDEDQKEGTNSVVFDASTLPSGTYLYRLTAAGLSEAKKMQIVK